MKSLHLESGGYPGTIKTLKQLRDMTEQVAHVVSQMCGNLVIVSGVEDQGGGVYSDGWVVIDGELLPFVGGALNTHVTIVETVEQVQYLKDEDNNGIGDFVDAYTERYATFTDVATDNYLFQDFVRYEDTNSEIIRFGILRYFPALGDDLQALVDFGTGTELPGDTASDIKFEIDFEEVAYDYHVLITERQISNNPTLLIPQIVQKSNNSFIVKFKTLDNSSINNLTGVYEYDVSLLKII